MYPFLKSMAQPTGSASSASLRTYSIKDSYRYLLEAHRVLKPGGKVWAGHAGFHIDAFFDGDVPHIAVAEPLTSDEGRVIEGKASFGQSVCILSK